MPAAVETESDLPKRHSAFAQVMFRKIGEAVDLGGKAVVGVSGFESIFKVHRLGDVDWIRLLAGLILGSGIAGLGIYLQAKAEET